MPKVGDRGVAISLLLILFFAVVSISEIGIVKAQGTIYIREDGSVEGTDKIQREGNIYLFQGNLSGFIVVEKDSIVIDGSGFWLKGSGSEDETGINLINRKDVTIKNLNITNFGVGIGLFNTTSTTIINNKLSNNNGYPASIYLANSSNNNVAKNVVELNLQNGLWLRDFSNNNIVSENVITDSVTTGITVGGSNNTLSGNILDNSPIVLSGEGKANTITENRISNTGGSAIWTLHENSENTISGNNIFECNVGINLDTSNNVIYENNVTGNKIGVNLVLAIGNLFHHNNFVENEKQVAFQYGRFSPAYVNVWSNQQEGNYWSNYNGTDNNSDGIGDTPYIVDQNNQDNYPLMEPIIIPEFPSWIILPLFVTATLIGILVRKRVMRTRTAVS